MPLKTHQDEAVGVNLTPMIDVVFLLVIFFMVATHFSEAQRNIDLELPQVPTAGDDATPTRPRIVSVSAEGRIGLDGQPVTIERLTEELSQAVAKASDLQVVIHGDARSHFQDVAVALAACRDARVSDLGITVEIAAGVGPLRR